MQAMRFLQKTHVMTWALSYESVVGTSESTNAAYHTAGILKKNKLHHMRYRRKNKIKKKETTSIFFNMRGIYGNENNTQVNSYAIYTKTY